MNSEIMTMGYVSPNCEVSEMDVKSAILANSAGTSNMPVWQDDDDEYDF